MHADTAITWTVLSLLAFVLTGVGIWTLRRHFAHDFLDIPNQRSSHIMPTPRGGGIVFVAAFFVATGIAAATIPEETGGASSMFEVLVLVLLPLWIVGTVDDVRGLSARARYLVQLAAASLAVLFFGPFLGFDAILGSLGTPWLALALSVVAITALINFYNFMDGLDGIVGGTSAVQLAFFALYLHQPIWWLLVAALLAFLLWNWPPAKIFMGDSGSTVVGGAVALALLQAPDAKAMWWAGAVTAPLLGDAVFTLLRRLFKRENVFEAHKSHIYQRLNQSGWSHGLVSTTYVALTLLIAVLVATLT
jgi:UDP-N-acetylmuramyl pentapeptide phosphotransferase/UDP-N-acetylglucosamine-1-phosphate transferase